MRNFQLKNTQLSFSLLHQQGHVLGKSCSQWSSNAVTQNVLRTLLPGERGWRAENVFCSIHSLAKGTKNDQKSQWLQHRNSEFQDLCSISCESLESLFHLLIVDFTINVIKILYTHLKYFQEYYRQNYKGRQMGKLYSSILFCNRFTSSYFPFGQHVELQTTTFIGLKFFI